MGPSFADVLQEFALTNDVIEHSGAIEMFQRLPRWSGPTPRLNPQADYVIGLAFAGIIPIVAFVAVFVALIACVALRYSCLRESQDKRQSERRRRTPQSKLGHLLVSTFIMHAFLMSLAIGVVGAVVTSESALNVSNSVYALLVDIRKTGLSLMDFALWIKNQFISFDPATLEDGTDAGQFLATAFETLIEYIPPRFPEIGPLRSSLASLLEEIMAIITLLEGYVVWVFLGIAIMSVFISFALVFVFVQSMLKRRHYTCNAAILVLYFAVPFLISWMLFATWTGVGLVLANGCEMVDGYRQYLKFRTLSNDTNNLFIDSGLVCPTAEEAQRLESQILSTSDSILDNPLAADTITLLLSVNGSQLGDSTSWAASEIIEYINCNVLIRFSGRLESLICGARLTSLVAGILILWLSSLFLAIIVSVLVLCIVAGVPVMWSFTVWDVSQLSDSCVETEDDYD